MYICLPFNLIGLSITKSIIKITQTIEFDNLQVFVDPPPPEYSDSLVELCPLALYPKHTQTQRNIKMVKVKVIKVKVIYEQDSKD